MTEFDSLFIQQFQAFGEGILPFMKFFTLLGYSPFYFMVVLLICWCWNYPFGLKFGIFIAFNGALNDVLKVFFHAPRPYMIDDRIIRYGQEGSFGMPSGHAQGAAAAGGYLIARCKHIFLRVFVLLLIVLIGLSRIYLGVHSPTQVLAGWGTGLVLAAIFLLLETQVKTWWNTQTTLFQIFIILDLAAALILIALLRLFSYRVIPDLYDMALLNFWSILMTSSLFTGLGIGGILLCKNRALIVRTSWWKQVLKIVIGLLSLAGFLLVVILSKRLQDQPLVLGTFLVLTNLFFGFWSTCLGPLIFLKLGLMQVEE